MKNKHSTSTVYLVSYGPKREADREWKRFDDAESANEFFQMKQRDFHCDIYEETTMVAFRKLTTNKK